MYYKFNGLIVYRAYTILFFLIIIILFNAQHYS